VGYWEFEEGEGTLTKNAVSGGPSIELLGASWRRGRANRSIEFNGTGKARLTDDRTVDFTRSDLSFALWLQTDSGGTILSRTVPDSPWIPAGVSLFVRDGKVRLPLDSRLMGNRQFTKLSEHRSVPV
jgi:hypothetical protein